MIEVENWEDLAGWLGVDKNEIETECNRKAINLAHCYKKRLVRLYCDRTGKSPQQVAEDMAWIYEHRIKNKRVAKELRLLTFSELSRK